MMEFGNPQESPSDLTAETPFQSLPADRAACDALIEDYLDRVFAPMVEVVPYERRVAARQEMREHLDGLIAAYVEIDTPPEEAAACALAQFGEAERISRQWLSELEIAGRLPEEHSARLSKVIALRWFGWASVAGAVLLLTTGDRINYSSYAYLQALLLLALPAFAGTGTGIMAPARSSRCAYRALATLAIPTMLVYAAWGCMQHFSAPLHAGLVFGTLHLICWSIVGTASAGISGWLRRLTLRARRRWALR